jgi:putative ABC transport system permease protein
VLKGRNFSRQFNDSASVILNEEAVAQIGWKDPVGKWIKYPGNDDQRFHVIGVVKNFNVESMHTAIIPFALFSPSSKTYDIGATHMVAKVKPNDLIKTINNLENKWKSFSVAEPFDYKFLDAEFDAKYRSEQRLGKLFTIFTCLSIFIACLGLFGLCSFMAERRMKELGVRKVLGASVFALVNLLTKDFVKLTVIAVMIASPIAWYALHAWLQDFAYRIEIGWVIFVIAGLGTIGITLCTVSYQAIKAASVNPIKSLRTE